MAAKPTTVDVDWNGKGALLKAQQRMRINAHAVGMMLDSATVRAISKGQPVKRTAKGNLIGLKPSKPGQPPKVLHGLLRDSISYRVVTEPSTGSIIVYFGANTDYAKDLEYGVPGRVKPRPFLRPTLEKNRKKAYGMFTRGIFKK